MFTFVFFIYLEAAKKLCEIQQISIDTSIILKSFS